MAGRRVIFGDLESTDEQEALNNLRGRTIITRNLVNIINSRSSPLNQDEEIIRKRGRKIKSKSKEKRPSSEPEAGLRRSPRKSRPISQPIVQNSNNKYNLRTPTKSPKGKSPSASRTPSKSRSPSKRYSISRFSLDSGIGMSSPESCASTPANKRLSAARKRPSLYRLRSMDKS